MPNWAPATTGDCAWASATRATKSEVVHWVLKKPSLDHRIAIDQSIDRSLKALAHLRASE